MATVTVYPDETIEKDPNDKRVIVWDANTLNLAAGVQLVSAAFTIKRLEPKPGQDRNTLTFDNDDILDGNRSVQVRILGGTLGGKYQLTLIMVTNETPFQDKSFSVFVRVVDK